MGAIADIILHGGDAQAAGLREGGRIYGQLGQQLGQIPGQTYGQIMEQRKAKMQSALGQTELEANQLALKEKQKQQADQATSEAAYKASLKPDGSFDREGLTARIAQTAPDLLPKVIEQLDTLDASHGKLQQQQQATQEQAIRLRDLQADHVAAIARTVKDHGYDPGAFGSALALAQSQGLDISQAQQAFQQGRPIKDIVDTLIAQSPSEQAAAAKRRSETFTLKPGEVAKSGEGETLATGGPLPPKWSNPEPGVVDGKDGNVMRDENDPKGVLVDAITKQPVKSFVPRANAFQGDPNVKLDDDAVDMGAMRVHLLGTGSIPTRISGSDRTRILNKEAEIGKTLGQSPAVAVMKQLAVKADSKSLDRITTLADASKAAQAKAEPLADLIEQLSDKVDRTQYPIINRALLAGETKIAGNADATSLLNALTEFTSEYAKIVEGSASTGAGATVEARRAAAGLVTAAMNKGTVKTQLAQMRQIMDFTNKGYDATTENIQGRMRSAGQAPTPAPASAPVPQHKVGDPVVGVDGKTVYVTAVSPDGTKIQTSPTKPRIGGGG